MTLIGMNGSGKTSTLQFFGLVREFARGKSERFFDERNWLRKDLRSKLASSSQNKETSVIRADLLFETPEGEKLLWQFNSGLNSGLNVRELVWIKSDRGGSPEKLIDFRNGDLEAPNYAHLSIRGIKLSGSVLSIIHDQFPNSSANIPHELFEWANGITSLELLSPVAMRRLARGQKTDIGPRGERLSNFLALLDAPAKSRVVERMREFYPLERIDTTRKRAGWVDLRIAESFRDIGAIAPAHISDGFLRLLALCTIPEFPKEVALILLDEIEDGIDPHILPQMIARITSESSAQFIMTSHSPVFINFLGNDEIVFLGRLSDGRVAATRFGDLDVVKEGLEYFGAGEMWTMLGKSTLEEELSRKAELGVELTVSRSISRFNTPSVEAFMEFD